MASEPSDEGQFLLATLPPSKQQFRLALCIVTALLVVVLAIVPFANVQLPELGAILPALLSVGSISELIVSALLFSQFFVLGRTALFVLAISYLFTGLMMIPFMLTLPGAFSPTGLLGAGLQSPIYIASFYRVAAPLGVIAYTVLRNRGSKTSLSGRSPVAVLIGSVVVVIAVVCGLTWLTIAQDAVLPTMFVDRVHPDRGGVLIRGAFLLALNAAALALLWAWRRSLLDLWLMVMCSSWVLVLVISTFITDVRFTVGWYGARGFEVFATMVVLLALLSETTALYAKLGQSVIRERGARAARQIAMDAMAAAIAHELKQPLAAIAMDGSAALRWMARAEPDEARAAIEAVIGGAHHASDVIDGIRSMFKKESAGRAWLNINDLVSKALVTLDADLRTHQVQVSIELSERLAPLPANRAQLEEVFSNLIMNAIEAMQAVTDRARLLRITSNLVDESSTVLVTVEDAGTGFASANEERIFEPFFTTKSHGMGIGLAICRAIVEAHGGSLRASSNQPYGTIFHVALPVTAGQLD